MAQRQSSFISIQEKESNVLSNVSDCSSRGSTALIKSCFSVKLIPRLRSVICVSGLRREQYVINISRCLNVTRKADWTFLYNLATFGGFLFSYFPRFTIGSLVQVIILGPFTSQVAVTSKYGAKTRSVIFTRITGGGDHYGVYLQSSCFPQTDF